MTEYIGISALSAMIAYGSTDIEQLEQSLDLNENADAYERLAMCYEKLLSDDPIMCLNYDETVFYYEKAIELDPTNRRIIYNFAEFWRSVGNKSEAIRYLKKGVALNDLECIIILVYNYYNIGNRVEFLKYYLMTNYIITDIDDIHDLYSRETRSIYKEYIMDKIFEAYDLLDRRICKLLLKPLVGDSEKYIAHHKARMRNHPKINAMINKIDLFTRLNNFHECVICYEQKLNIALNCGHELCVDCYKRTNVCHYRCG
jgi:hypothetical protein